MSKEICNICGEDLESLSEIEASMCGMCEELLEEQYHQSMSALNEVEV